MTARTLPLALALLFAWAVAAHAQVPSFPDSASLVGKGAGELVLREGTYDEGPADWGFLLVPERRARTGSRLLHLIVVRQRARGEAAEPPLFNLVGGPGESNVFGSGVIPPEILEHADAVRVGYRGIDDDVGLTCPEYSKALLTERPLSAANIERARRALALCNERLRSLGIDVDGYTLAEVVEDLEAARRALGYEKIRFLAVSWGTQIAYAYAMRYPERVDRMLLMGAGGRQRGFDLWDPRLVDVRLGQYGARWRQDPLARARVPDIVAALRGVLAALPATWRGVTIDPDKVALGVWYLLENTEGAAQALDAVAAWTEGDSSGVALLSWGYDEEVKGQLRRTHGPYHGEFFSKVMSSGLDPVRDWVAETEVRSTVLGSPAARFLWGAGSRGGWPIRIIPEAYRRDMDIDTPTLVLMGNLDLYAPPEYVKSELMPHLRGGELVVLSDMGHTDPAALQPDAFRRAAVRFLREGVVDTSLYVHHNIDFTPEETLGALARRVIPEASEAK